MASHIISAVDSTQKAFLKVARIVKISSLIYDFYVCIMVSYTRTDSVMLLTQVLHPF